YLGPYIVVKRHSGGAYTLADLDGSVFRHTIARFRVIPYLSRKDLSGAIETVLRNLDNADYADGIDQGMATVEEVVESDIEGLDNTGIGADIAEDEEEDIDAADPETVELIEGPERRIEA
ncbi:hypothetical protein CALCODRAFT_444693, partial [Calocera cornea HHB12733]